jgi:hypothetical protein
MYAIHFPRCCRSGTGDHEVKRWFTVILGFFCQKHNVLASIRSTSKLLIFLPLLTGLSGTVFAQRYETVHVPNATNTDVNGINDEGLIVGDFDDVDGLTKGFYRDRQNRFHAIMFPGSTSTVAQQINNEGTIAGLYAFADGRRHGFILRRGKFETVDFPGAISTKIRGLDDRGDVMGNYSITGDDEEGFILDPTGIYAVNYPDSLTTDVWDENQWGLIVGDYTDSTPDENIHGYTLFKGHFATLDYPGYPVTSLRGANEAGVIVGQFAMDDFLAHGFVKKPRGGFIRLDIPGAAETAPNRINKSGTIVGSYSDATDTIFHGFILTNWEGLACENSLSENHRAPVRRWAKGKRSDED